jgi:hypothetical protein
MSVLLSEYDKLRRHCGHYAAVRRLADRFGLDQDTVLSLVEKASRMGPAPPRKPHPPPSSGGRKCATCSTIVYGGSGVFCDTCLRRADRDASAAAARAAGA